MDYDERKNEILNTAQKLFYSVGYEKTTISAIIDDLGIAKGTFYHYFNSKVELLDELVERMALQIMTAIESIVNSNINAVEKFNKIFETARTIKLDNIDIMIPAMKILYSDENIITRHKMNKKNIERLSPVYTKVIKQGIAEGIFNTQYPEQAGKILIYIWLGLGETMVNMFSYNTDVELINKEIFAFEDAMERVLGLKDKSFKFVDEKIIESFVKKLK